MSPNVRRYLFDMQHAVLGILSFVDGRTIDDFKNDLMLRSAIERQFEIIGEAMTRLLKESPELCDKISEAPRIVGFRNVLIHGYDTLNNDITWRIVQDKLPILQRELQELIAAG
jgi:uncharacterized protein with HEPN domain